MMRRPTRSANRAVGAEDHPTRIRIDQIGHRLAATFSTAALRRADGCGPTVVAVDPRKAVDTVVATESGTSMHRSAPTRRPAMGATPHTGDVVCHASHLRASLNSTNRHDLGARPHAHRAGPGYLGRHTSPVSLAVGVLIAVLLLLLPGAIVARTGRLTWPASLAVGPALTYGTVALTIIPFGALGIPWNAWTALFAWRS